MRGLAPEKKKIKPLSEQTLRRFIELADWTSDLIKTSGIEWEVKIPKDGQKASLDFEELVTKERGRLEFKPEVRRRWSSESDAFEWWRSRIESLGVFCFIMKLAPGDIRGASIWRPSGFPAVLVNHEDIETSAGRIFTLIHEYGHLILKRSGYACDFRGSQQGSTIERHANRFAAHMLVNEAEFVERLKQLNLDKYQEEWGDSTLDKIRQDFKVSRNVIVIKLEELKFAPEGFYQTKRMQWDKRKPFGRRSLTTAHTTLAERKLRAIGYSLAKILSHPSIEQCIPLLDLSYVLDMKIKQTDQFLEWLRERPVLRV